MFNVRFGWNGCGMLCAFLVLTACAEPLTEDEQQATYLWEVFKGSDQYLTWSYFPGQGTLYKSGDHSGTYAVSYLNPVAEEALTRFDGTLPEGSVIIKAQFKDAEGTQPYGYTAMWKVAGYDSDHNDWFWAGYTPDGTITQLGKEPYCYNCHGQASENDYVLTYEFTP